MNAVIVAEGSVTLVQIDDYLIGSICDHQKLITELPGVTSGNKRDWMTLQGDAKQEHTFHPACIK